ncbi:MAG TPA: hypothetical protein VN904_01870 [Chthoniobacterales bacterium]|nr:hypothetical protein [Chthoniobacterales bacterium]
MKNHTKPVTPTSAVRRLPTGSRRPLADEIAIVRAHIRFLQIVLGRLPNTASWQQKKSA